MSDIIAQDNAIDLQTAVIIKKHKDVDTFTFQRKRANIMVVASFLSVLWVGAKFAFIPFTLNAIVLGFTTQGNLGQFLPSLFIAGGTTVLAYATKKPILRIIAYAKSFKIAVEERDN